MKTNKEIRIRIYRALNNPDACIRFSEGHSQVLASYGIKKVTSAEKEWFGDPKTYLILVESPCGKTTYGGARLQLKSREFKLPIEKAIGSLDPMIYDLMNDNQEFKTGELCGLWNAKIMSGSGLSVLLVRSGVARAGIFVARKFNIQSLYTLSAPWTINMVKEMGFTVEESIGKNGTFEYPSPDLIATILVLKDINSLEKASIKERKNIFDLREHPVQKKTENGPKGPIEVEYELINPGSNSLEIADLVD
ncbi:hypothetical protein N9R81_00530 [Flavobacteriales bacterium]|nr:hypothetical protein [Flavobacteriales bacterium]